MSVSVTNALHAQGSKAKEKKASREDCTPQVAYLSGSMLWCVHTEFDVQDTWKGPGRSTSRYMKFCLHKIALNGSTGRKVYQFNDGLGTTTGKLFFRWRLTEDSFWATERDLDDQHSGILRIKTDGLPRFEAALAKTNHHFWSDSGIRNVEPGARIICSLADAYWENKGIGIDAGPLFPGQPGWPLGNREIFFDFLPRAKGGVLLFVLFSRHSMDNNKVDATKFPTKLLQVWTCPGDGKERATRGFPIYTRVQNAERLVETIDADLEEPFYAFEKEQTFFFLTWSGKLFRAEPPRAVPAEITRKLIDALDDPSFQKRGEAEKALLEAGKGLQRPLEEALKGRISLEQRTRIERVVETLRKKRDRKIVPCWNDQDRPIQNLLVDHDSGRTFCFFDDKRGGTTFFEVGVYKLNAAPLTKPPSSLRSLPNELHALYENGLTVWASREKRK
jgi:hypothetical protein